ncbi:phage head closure protein [Anaerotignum sp. MB30-C6]|uniref:phage head closure protein n=1 Tax=Anaerotignum sp. MB30-C6 TaxID=3070814 RepID=UPI0027DBB7FD|nr:phage head closure protein [Anaerotignum sp. MB30-C6]WMI80906.1 phage head closure protein [Anaerotignum sp. MB30-C6]
MQDIATKLNRKAELWGNKDKENELGELDQEPVKIKDLYVAIIPQTGKLQNGQGNTILSSVTTKFICRYQKGITYDMWLVYNGTRHDIKYILDPYAEHAILEIFCEEVVE